MKNYLLSWETAHNVTLRYFMSTTILGIVIYTQGTTLRDDKWVNIEKTVSLTSLSFSHPSVPRANHYNQLLFPSRDSACIQVWININKNKILSAKLRTKTDISKKIYLLFLQKVSVHCCKTTSQFHRYHFWEMNSIQSHIFTAQK